MSMPDFKDISTGDPKWFGLSKRYWRIILIELVISLVLSVLSSGKPHFPFIKLNLDTPYGPILVTIIGIIIFSKPATNLIENLEHWKNEGSRSREANRGVELLGIPKERLKTWEYHDKIVLGSVLVMIGVILLDILRLGLSGWVDFLGYLSPYVRAHAPWAFYLRVVLSLTYYALLVWIYAYWASFMAYFVGYLSVIRSLNSAKVSPVVELGKLADSKKSPCLMTPTNCIKPLTNIAESFVELGRQIKMLFGPGLSVASALLAVSVLSAVYVVVTKYTSIPQNDAGLISGWGFLLGSLVLFGVLMHMASSFVSAIKEETITYLHKIRIGLINSGGNKKAYELLDEIERALETIRAIPLRSDELLELVSIAISVIMALLTGSG
ncbi:hypothetical protein [Thermococcus prieurii]